MPRSGAAVPGPAHDWRPPQSGRLEQLGPSRTPVETSLKNFSRWSHINSVLYSSSILPLVMYLSCYHPLFVVRSIGLRLSRCVRFRTVLFSYLPRLSALLQAFLPLRVAPCRP